MKLTAARLLLILVLTIIINKVSILEATHRCTLCNSKEQKISVSIGKFVIYMKKEARKSNFQLYAESIPGIKCSHRWHQTNDRRHGILTWTQGGSAVIAPICRFDNEKLIAGLEKLPTVDLRVQALESLLCRRNFCRTLAMLLLIELGEKDLTSAQIDEWVTINSRAFVTIQKNDLFLTLLENFKNSKNEEVQRLYRAKSEALTGRSGKKSKTRKRPRN